MTRAIARNGIIREKEYRVRARAGAPMKPMNQPPWRGREERSERKRENTPAEQQRERERKRRGRKGRKAAGERSSRRLSCNHRGVPSPEKKEPRAYGKRKTGNAEGGYAAAKGAAERGGGGEKRGEQEERDHGLAWTLSRSFCTNTPRRSVSQSFVCTPLLLPRGGGATVLQRKRERKRGRDHIHVPPSTLERRKERSKEEPSRCTTSATTSFISSGSSARCESRLATTGLGKCAAGERCRERARVPRSSLKGRVPTSSGLGFPSADKVELDEKFLASWGSAKDNSVQKRADIAAFADLDRFASVLQTNRNHLEGSEKLVAGSYR